MIVQVNVKISKAEKTLEAIKTYFVTICRVKLNASLQRHRKAIREGEEVGEGEGELGVQGRGGVREGWSKGGGGGL